jgi:hypothetical protein
MNNPATSPEITPRPPDAPAFERGLWNRAWFMILLCLVFVALDWELVPLQVFPFVFIFPVMLVAWNRFLWLSAGCAGLLSFTRIMHQLVFSTQPVVVDEFADTLICFFVLQLLAALTTQLGRQSRRLRQRVRTLEGLLPICSFCKSIRNDRGEWERVENYVSRHGATLSHGLCPDCAKKHYGEFYPPKNSG